MNVYQKNYKFGIYTKDLHYVTLEVKTLKIRLKK